MVNSTFLPNLVPASHPNGPEEALHAQRAVHGHLGVRRPEERPEERPDHRPAWVLLNKFCKPFCSTQYC